MGWTDKPKRNGTYWLYDKAYGVVELGEVYGNTCRAFDYKGKSFEGVSFYGPIKPPQKPKSPK